MPAVLTAIGTDALNTFEDLSGISTSSSVLSPHSGATLGGPGKQLDGSPVINGLDERKDSVIANPYNAMLYLAQEEPAVISKAYDTHRTVRNAKFAAQLRSPDFPGVNIDTILLKIEKAKAEGRDPNTDEVDPRHCLVFWARPPKRIRELVKRVQERLRTVANDLWIMPENCLHMTVLEITHSTTEEAISNLVNTLIPSLDKILSHTQTHRARLTRPLLSFDAAAMAISFLPSPTEEDKYTYHHLRRDIYALSTESGVEVDSRYVLPSAHITVGRFTDAQSLKGVEKMKEWMDEIDAINEWLSTEMESINWEVGEERGLDCRRGRLWYGGGETVQIGKGF